MKAIELFGGIKGVRRKINDAVCNRVSKKTVGELPKLAVAVGLPPEILSKIVLEKADVAISYRVFEKLSCALSISIDEVFGNPEFKNADDEAAWRDAYQHTRVAGAACGLDEGASATLDQIPFETFLALRGVEELATEMN